LPSAPKLPQFKGAAAKTSVPPEGKHYSECFAQTAALQREGRALCEKSKEDVRLGRWCHMLG